MRGKGKGTAVKTATEKPKAELQSNSSLLLHKLQSHLQ